MKKFAELFVVWLLCVSLHEICAATPKRPPGILQRWNLQEDDIEQLMEAYENGIVYIKNLGKELVSTDIKGEAVLKKILECERMYRGDGTIGAVFAVGSLVANFLEVRKYCGRFKGRLAKAFLEFDMLPEVYYKLVAFKASNDHYTLSDEHKKCLDKLIENRKRVGLDIKNRKTRQEIENIQKRIIELQNKFRANLTNEKTKLYFTEEQLAGLDPELENLKKEKTPEGKIPVTLNLPLLSKCSNPETRKEVKIASQSRGTKENPGILKELLVLRARLANLLKKGLTYAEFVQQPLMAENPKQVMAFLEKLKSGAESHWKDELKVMLDLKKIECEKFKCDATKLEEWEYAFFYKKMLAKEYSLDTQKLKEYFPLTKVLEGMFKIFQTVLGLEITPYENAERWHEDVSVHQIHDVKTKKLLGYFYLDLYSREEKSCHATMLTLQLGCYDGEEKQKSVGALLFDFPKGTTELPTLLSHGQVESLIGRFVHIMNETCNTAQTSIFNGNGVQAEFFNAASYMAESWCYEKESLLLISEHYKTKEPIPPEMIQQLVKSRASDGGSQILWQLVYGITDQELHNMKIADLKKPDFDPLETYKKNLSKLLGFEVSAGTNPLASWVHLGGPMGATYYSYQWSEVYGVDMFDSTFKANGILSPEVGARLRKEVMAPGGTRKADEAYKNFVYTMNLGPFFKRFEHEVSKGI